jgi:hypothetical protein
MIRRWWDALYEKRAQVDARRSGLGCLLASLGLIAVCAVMALLAGRPFILGQPEAARSLMAQHALEEIEDALVLLLQDAGTATPADLFAPGALPAMESFDATATAHGQLLRALLLEGNATDLEVLPGARTRLAPTYLHVRQDPWGHPYRALLRPGAEETPSAWTLICTGANGALDLPEAGDDLLRVHR